MKAEKTTEERTSRTIQQKSEQNGALEFVDNRTASPIQRIGEDEEETMQLKAQEDHINSDNFIAECSDRSDYLTHIAHMRSNGIIKNDEKFISKSHKEAYNEAYNQSYNRIKREREKANKMKKDTSKAAKLAQLKPNNTGMPDSLKAGVESLSGYSMDDVRVHYNSDKPAAVQAHAYTQGQDIHVAPGQEQHLPHEAWHVAQQMAGRVEPTTEIGGMPVNDSVGLEREADIMGDRANQF